MADAADVDRQLELAWLAILKARACWAEWVAPPPDFECELSDEEYAKRREVDLVAGRAERELRAALKVIRERFLGWPPAEAYDTGSDGGGDDPGGEDTAVRLLEQALFLRMNGERPPGAPRDDPEAETWRDWDRRAEAFLRSRMGG